MLYPGRFIWVESVDPSKLDLYISTEFQLHSISRLFFLIFA